MIKDVNWEIRQLASKNTGYFSVNKKQEARESMDFICKRTTVRQEDWRLKLEKWLHNNNYILFLEEKNVRKGRTENQSCQTMAFQITSADNFLTIKCQWQLHGFYSVSWSCVTPTTEESNYTPNKWASWRQKSCLSRVQCMLLRTRWSALRDKWSAGLQPHPFLWRHSSNLSSIYKPNELFSLV
jgi:hypothetical protein